MGNERYLNVLFDEFLQALPRADLVRLITDLFGIPLSSPHLVDRSPQIQAFLKIPNGEIDEFIDFGDILGMAIELKAGWKTSPGQLHQYFDYAHSLVQKPYLVYISQSSDDVKLRWIAPLFLNNSWKHITWQRLSKFLNDSGYAVKYEPAGKLNQYLKECSLSLDRKRPERDYGLRLPLPASFEVNLDVLKVVELAKDGPLAGWKSAQNFWTDVVDSIWGQLGEIDFFTYRRDLYHYMFRWAFQERNVFFDMRKDNYWEHYFEYYQEHMEGKVSGMESVMMSSWYYKYLRIAKNQFIQFERFNLGVVSVIGKDCYFVIRPGGGTKRLTLLNCWEVFPW